MERSKQVGTRSGTSLVAYFTPTAQSWLYLAVILDVYSRAVVGWSISACCDEALVERALKMAVARRRPQAGLLHHSDRGFQYTSHAYRRQLELLGMIVTLAQTLQANRDLREGLKQAITAIESQQERLKTLEGQLAKDSHNRGMWCSGTEKWSKHWAGLQSGLTTHIKKELDR